MDGPLILRDLGQFGHLRRTRTRDLCRDSPPFEVFQCLQTRGERLRPTKSYKTSLFVDQIVDQIENQVSQPPYVNAHLKT
jgi:hypothetical protein